MHEKYVHTYKNASFKSIYRKKIQGCHYDKKIFYIEFKNANYNHI